MKGCASSSFATKDEATLLRSRRDREDPTKPTPLLWDPQLERAVDALQGTLLHAKNN